MLKMKLLGLLLLLVWNITSFAECQFWDADCEARQQQYQKQRQVGDLLSVSCPHLKGQKVALVIAESVADGFNIGKIPNYGSMYRVMNASLRRSGFRTYRQEQIDQAIAQEEQELIANFRDGEALLVAKRLGAPLSLKGIIYTRTHHNDMANLTEVYVTMSFSLTDNQGRTVADVSTTRDSFSGADVYSVALDLVREESNMIAAKLYQQYCQYTRR